MSSREIERGTQRVVQDISHEDIPLSVYLECARFGNMDPLSSWLVMHNFRLIEPLPEPSQESIALVSQLVRGKPHVLEKQFDRSWNGKNMTSGVVVGRIEDINKHPNADRLWVAEVDVGEDEPRQIVHGGTRELKKDDLVAVALPGAMLKNGEKIRPRNWRGVKSYGMLCSWRELGRRPESIHTGNEVAVFSPTKKRDIVPAHYVTSSPYMQEKLRPGTPL